MTNLDVTYTAQDIYEITEELANDELYQEEVPEITQEYLDDLSMAAFLDQLYKD